MKINDRELERPLVVLRLLLGDERVEELQGVAAELRSREDYTAEELMCLAEYFRLLAEGSAWVEEKRAAAHR